MAPVKSAKATGPTKRLARKSATAGPSRKSNKPSPKLPSSLTKQVKSRTSAATANKKKKKPVYTEKQLSLPVLNSIVPATAKTVQRAGGTGKKKGKVFVDDVESMTTILAMVNAEKEGVIESKVARERQLEEIREARRKEAEVKEEARRGRFEKVKGEIKGEEVGRKRRRSEEDDGGKNGRESGRVGEKRGNDGRGVRDAQKGKRKSVSFA